jgi:hypothetical protein
MLAYRSNLLSIEPAVVVDLTGLLELIKSDPIVLALHNIVFVLSDEHVFEA